jgi:hypothetical protein
LGFFPRAALSESLCPGLVWDAPLGLGSGMGMMRSIGGRGRMGNLKFQIGYFKEEPGCVGTSAFDRLRRGWRWELWEAWELRQMANEFHELARIGPHPWPLCHPMEEGKCFFGELFPGRRSCLPQSSRALRRAGACPELVWDAPLGLGSGMGMMRSMGGMGNLKFQI